MQRHRRRNHLEFYACIPAQLKLVYSGAGIAVDEVTDIWIVQGLPGKTRRMSTATSGAPVYSAGTWSGVKLCQTFRYPKEQQDSETGYSLLMSRWLSVSKRVANHPVFTRLELGVLSEAEQIFLRQLSVFTGGWTINSAQAVCNGNILSLINALVKKSLIVVKQETGRETRYRFHEIARQYVRKKLVESGEEETIRDRHLKYFLQLSEEADPALEGPVQTEWYARLSHERDNIRTALEWADKTDVEAGLYISGRLQLFWANFDMREGIRWLERFLKKTETRNHLQARVSALQTYAVHMIWVQQFTQASLVAQECLEIQHGWGDQGGELDILLVLGDSLIFSGEFE